MTLSLTDLSRQILQEILDNLDLRSSRRFLQVNKDIRRRLVSTDGPFENDERKSEVIDNLISCDLFKDDEKKIKIISNLSSYDSFLKQWLIRSGCEIIENKKTIKFIINSREYKSDIDKIFYQKTNNKFNIISIDLLVIIDGKNNIFRYFLSDYKKLYGPAEHYFEGIVKKIEYRIFNKDRVGTVNMIYLETSTNFYSFDTLRDKEFIYNG